MKFTRNTVNGINDTILASNDYDAIPFTVTEDAAVKAGYPMTLAGKKAKTTGSSDAATSDAAGILLYDVDPTENPNGALLVRGIVDQKKATASSAFGYTADDLIGLKKAIPTVIFRNNIGVNS